MSWEYMVIDRTALNTPLELEGCLNRHGTMGWELSLITQAMVILKRILQ